MPSNVAKLTLESGTPTASRSWRLTKNERLRVRWNHRILVIKTKDRIKEPHLPSNETSISSPEERENNVQMGFAKGYVSSQKG